MTLTPDCKTSSHFCHEKLACTPFPSILFPRRSNMKMPTGPQTWECHSRVSGPRTSLQSVEKINKNCGHVHANISELLLTKPGLNFQLQKMLQAWRPLAMQYLAIGPNLELKIGPNNFKVLSIETRESKHALPGHGTHQIILNGFNIR